MTCYKYEHKNKRLLIFDKPLLLSKYSYLPSQIPIKNATQLAHLLKRDTAESISKPSLLLLETELNLL